MKIVQESINKKELFEMAQTTFGDMVKAVIDVALEELAVDAELNSDLEALFLEQGSKRKNLWGINLYPELESPEFIEFDSMINIRPSQGNRSREVENKEIREKIVNIINENVEQMTAYHEKLALGGWQKMSFMTQLANIGSEVERAIKWREKKNIPYSQRAAERALELIDLTLESTKKISRLKEKRWHV